MQTSTTRSGRVGLQAAVAAGVKVGEQRSAFGGKNLCVCVFVFK